MDNGKTSDVVSREDHDAAVRALQGLIAAERRRRVTAERERDAARAAIQRVTAMYQRTSSLPLEY